MRPRPGFVGRARELDLLAGQLDAALHGDGRLVLLGGEPGIGKSRLAEETAVAATAQGMRLVSARATEDDAAPPYWIFRQLVRQLAADRPPTGSLADDLAVLTPDLGSTASDSPTVSADRRFRAFEAVCDFLVHAADPGGLVLIADDLQWADPPSLRLVRRLAERVADARLLVLAIYRDTEIGGRPELSRLLAALARERAVTRIRLTGLTAPEVHAQLRLVTGDEVDPATAAAISRRSQGNPFFVAELGRLLDQRDGLPDVVRDAVRSRLDRLRPDARHLLRLAAVLGATIDPAALAAVADRDLRTVLAALDEAADTGLVVADGDWRFRHDLIRECARLELSTVDRLTAHARMADHLRAGVPVRPGEIAHHLLESLPLGDPALAAEWAERAADAALAVLAWEDAATLYGRALDVDGGFPEPADRSRLLRGRAVAQIRAADLGAAQESVLAAADAGRAAGDPTLIADAVLTLDTTIDPHWAGPRIALCEEALAALPPEPGQRRARLLAMLAAELGFTRVAEGDVHSRAALEMAEELGDGQALRAALRARQLARATPDGVRDRLALGDRLLAIGTADRDDEAIMWARLWRFDALVQLGRITDADAEIPLIADVVSRLRLPFARWHLLRCQAALDMGRGRYAEVEARATEAVELVERSGGHRQLLALSGAVLQLVAEHTGRPFLLRERTRVDTFAATEGFVHLRAVWDLRAGKVDAARAKYRPDRALAAMPVVSLLPALDGLIELAVALDDPDTVAEAYRRLRPHAELFVCGGAGLVGVSGSAHRPLGVAAAKLGRLDDAARHFQSAITANAGVGFAPYVALSRLGLAGVLARRRRPGDRDEAAALAASAGATARQLGMPRLLREAEELGHAVSGDVAGPLTRREREIAELVAQGLTNRQIAALSHISERTAENHVQHILTKLGFATRTQIATWITSGSAPRH